MIRHLRAWAARAVAMLIGSGLASQAIASFVVYDNCPTDEACGEGTFILYETCDSQICWGPLPPQVCAAKPPWNSDRGTYREDYGYTSLGQWCITNQREIAYKECDCFCTS